MRILWTALLTTMVAPTFGDDREGVVWLTGRALERKLDEPAGVRLQGIDLRQSLIDLGRRQRVSILLDRRVDPSRPLDLEAGGSLRSIVQRVAAERGAAATIVRGVVFLGPVGTSAALPTALQHVRKTAQALPKDARTMLQATRRWQWDDLSTPRELLAQLERESRWRFEGAEQIPHDLWAAADLPPLSWLDRASLVLAQYDCTLELNAARRTARIEPFPAEWLRPAEPPAVVARPRVAGGRQTATLQVREARLSDVLRSIAGQFELQLRYDPGLAPEILAAPVTFSARDLELRPLLEQLLRGRARFQLEDQTLSVLPP